MKRPRTAISSLALVLAGAAAYAEVRPSSFVTAIGGLEVGTPMQLNGRWQLPIRADVSGLHAITSRPTTMNSALACRAVNAMVKGNDIFLILETSVAHGAAKSACPDADLGHLASGSYNVWYGSSQVKETPLGTVRVAI